MRLAERRICEFQTEFKSPKMMVMFQDKERSEGVMERILFDDIAGWEFWVHPKGGSDYFYQYPPTRLDLAIRQRNKLLKDESVARVEPIVAIVAQSEGIKES